MTTVFVLSPSNQRRLSRDPQRVYKRARAFAAFFFLAEFQRREIARLISCDFGRWVALRERLATLIIIGPIVFGGRPLVGYIQAVLLEASLS